MVVYRGSTSEPMIGKLLCGRSPGLLQRRRLLGPQANGFVSSREATHSCGTAPDSHRLPYCPHPGPSSPLSRGFQAVRHRKRLQNYAFLPKWQSPGRMFLQDKFPLLLPSFSLKTISALINLIFMILSPLVPMLVPTGSSWPQLWPSMRHSCGQVSVTAVAKYASQLWP